MFLHVRDDKSNILNASTNFEIQLRETDELILPCLLYPPTDLCRSARDQDNPGEKTRQPIFAGRLVTRIIQGTKSATSSSTVP